MYDTVKELRNVHLKVEDLSQIKMEKTLFDRDKIDKRCVEYIKELYDDD